ncbi:MAG TPA: HAMP domain-containing sensor histidine kinase [Candidatus Dormibacteraeota bacterium]|nr:HAMP domain-containing sensor histidine kinase [Candidatus Dormibacteraeota bacterium]
MERDRRAGIERVIELGRWLILIFAAVSANFSATRSVRVGEVNLLLGSWALFNLAMTLALVARHLPGKRTQYAMTGLDIAVASGLIYLTGGFASTFSLTFYVVVIASSLRFGIRGSLLCATVISATYLAVGMWVAGTLPAADVYTSHIFLYYVVALATGLLAREVAGARARQIAHTFELEHAAFLELREVDRIKSEFIMLASHELRTPLAKIKAWLMLMQDAGDRLPVEAQKEATEVLRSESEALARLTDNLLCIAQLEAGEIRLKTGPVDLDEVIEQVFARFVEAADRKRFQCAIPDEARRVLADHERLALILACLVDNALKFSPEGEPVHLSAQRDGRSVRIDVRDNGRRIPDDQIDRIFASFYQVESPLTRQRGGSGVGLYLARQLTERMGGRIWVENRSVRGNCFSLTLPING